MALSTWHLANEQARRSREQLHQRVVDRLAARQLRRLANQLTDIDRQLDEIEQSER